MKMKVKFLVDRAVEAQGEIVQSFEKGRVYEMEPISARRWLRRNLAVEVIGKPAKPAPVESKTIEDVKKDDSTKSTRKPRTVKARAAAKADTEAPVLEADTKPASE